MARKTRAQLHFEYIEQKKAEAKEAFKVQYGVDMPVFKLDGDEGRDYLIFFDNTRNEDVDNDGQNFIEGRVLAVFNTMTGEFVPISPLFAEKG